MALASMVKFFIWALATESAESATARKDVRIMLRRGGDGLVTWLNRSRSSNNLATLLNG